MRFVLQRMKWIVMLCSGLSGYLMQFTSGICGVGLMGLRTEWCLSGHRDRPCSAHVLLCWPFIDINGKMTNIWFKNFCI